MPPSSDRRADTCSVARATASHPNSRVHEGPPLEPERGTATGRAALEGKVVHIRRRVDTILNTLGGNRRMCGLSHDTRCSAVARGRPIGVLIILLRTQSPFTDKQIELVTTFADQAVIAIENVRCSTKSRTRAANSKSRASTNRSSLPT